VNPNKIDKNYLVVKFRNVYERIPFDDIIYCESDGNYASIFYLKEGKVCRRNQNISLSGLNEKLPATVFFRFSGKHLINREWFTGVAVDGNNHVCQINHPALNEAVELPIPEKKWSEFKEEML
jgi:DNA-binding LytR/AlgR family response regulator